MTSVDWRSFCSEVTDNWVENQSPIGGEDIFVEIDETLVSRRKYNRGRLIQQVWLFGGIERISKKIFVVPLMDKNNNPLPRTKENLLALIRKFIVPGTTIVSDMWKAYNTLTDEGYVHMKINHSINFVDPDDRIIHTQNIERLWRDIKEHIKRPGIRSEYLKQYLGRYLFLKQYGDTALHQFLVETRKLYTPTLICKEKRTDCEGDADEEGNC